MEVGNNPPSTARPATAPPEAPQGRGDDRLLGSLAVREGYVSAQQVEEAVALQKKNTAPRKLGEILIEKGYITPKRLMSLLDIQSRQVRIVAADPARGGLFGQIALDLGFVPKEKIEQALQEQSVLSRSGSPAMLGQILLRKGWLQTGQFLEILKVQRRAILRCPGCDTFYRFEETDRGSKFACRRCGTIVPIPAAEPDEHRAGPSAAITPKSTAETGAQFGRYAIQEELGRGGMGIVYKALHKDLNTVFALKILRETEVSSAEVLDRFKREAQAEARLRHPNIVAIHDAGQEAGVHYLAMDYIEGDPLTTHMARGFKVRDMISRLEKVVRAVHHAHEQGIIHRDLKPANIMIDLMGEPHVMDFGLAKFLDDPKRIMLTKDGSFLGTPYYMAPEQIRGEARLVGPRSDVYSLGVILYEILCGRTPHVAPNSVEVFHKILTEEPPLPRLFNAKIHPDLQTICLKAIDKDSALRYATAGDFADDLRRYLEGEPIFARLQPWPLRALRRLRKNKSAALAGISLFLFAISGGLVLFLMSRDAREFEGLTAEARKAYDERRYQEALLHSQSALRLRPNDEGMKKFVEWVTATINKQREEFGARLMLDQKRRDAEPLVATARTMLEMIPRQMLLDPAGIIARAAEVEKRFDEALKIVPDHEEAILGRARARALSGAWAAALEDLDALLAKSPGRVEARYEAARLRLARVIEAKLHDSRPAAVPPGSGFLEVRKRAHTEFSEVWSSVSRDPARDLFAQAALRWLDGKTAEALTGLDRFVETYPADADAWRLRAMARASGGDPAGAESDLAFAIRYAPADPVHRLARAWVRHGRADKRGADEDLAAAAGLAPRSPAPFLLLGRILLERGETGPAADAFEASEKLEAGAAAPLGAALVKLKKSDFEGALEPLARAAGLDSGDAWPLLLQSEAYESLERHAESLVAAESAVRVSGESAAAFERRARVLSRLSRFAEAVKDLERVIAIDPSSGPRLDAELKAAKERAGRP